MILGAQLFTLRDYCKDLDGLEESIKRVAAMGYRSIQLSGVCAYEGEWIAEICKKYGVTADITHYDYNKIINDTEETVKKHSVMNCKCIGIGVGPFGEAQTAEALEQFYEQLSPVLPKITSAGHKFMYHNHNWEFAKIGDKTFLDLVCEKFAPEEFGITLDTYWVQAGGADPAAWIRKLAGRVDRIHFKDMVYSSEDKNIRIAPIGEGNMNYDTIIKACLDTGVEIGYVELDNCYGEDPFDCLKRSYDYLNSRYGLQ
jgi:sugar phosphate isomerase/epimerase